MNFRLAISGSEKVRVAALIADESVLAALRAIAAQEGWRLQVLHDRAAVPGELARHSSVVLCDGDWRAILSDLAGLRARSRTILVAREIGDKLWLEVLERGGYDVVTSSVQERRLIDAVTRAWAELTK